MNILCFFQKGYRGASRSTVGVSSRPARLARDGHLLRDRGCTEGEKKLLKIYN